MPCPSITPILFWTSPKTFWKIPYCFGHVQNNWNRSKIVLIYRRRTRHTSTILQHHMEIWKFEFHFINVLTPLCLDSESTELCVSFFLMFHPQTLFKAVKNCTKMFSYSSDFLREQQNYDKISQLIWHNNLVNFKLTKRFCQIFLAFLENSNLKFSCW